MSELTKLLGTLLPPELQRNILDRADTLLRGGLGHSRHPSTQAGMVTTEDGTAELRSGKDGSDTFLTLHTDGTGSLSCPRGLAMTGPIAFPDLPSEAVTFDLGGLQFNPAWQPSGAPFDPRQPDRPTHNTPEPVFSLYKLGDVSVMALLPGEKEPSLHTLAELLGRSPLYLPVGVHYSAPETQAPGSVDYNYQWKKDHHFSEGY